MRRQLALLTAAIAERHDAAEIAAARFLVSFDLIRSRCGDARPRRTPPQ
jgi:hypothetical protein